MIQFFISFILPSLNEPRLPRYTGESTPLAVTLSHQFLEHAMLRRANVKPGPGELALLLMIVMHSQKNMLKLSKVSVNIFVENKGRLWEEK